MSQNAFLRWSQYILDNSSISFGCLKQWHISQREMSTKWQVDEEKQLNERREHEEVLVLNEDESGCLLCNEAAAAPTEEDLWWRQTQSQVSDRDEK